MCAAIRRGDEAASRQGALSSVDESGSRRAAEVTVRPACREIRTDRALYAGSTPLGPRRRRSEHPGDVGQVEEREEGVGVEEDAQGIAETDAMLIRVGLRLPWIPVEHEFSIYLIGARIGPTTWVMPSSSAISSVIVMALPANTGSRWLK